VITIPFSNEDLTRVRVSRSPLWETVFSFWGLLHHGRNTVHAPWAARARRVLPGTDLSSLIAAMCLERHCPDFLTPPPDASVAIIMRRQKESHGAKAHDLRFAFRERSLR
jgi:hypothetical protein